MDSRPDLGHRCRSVSSGRQHISGTAADESRRSVAAWTVTFRASTTFEAKAGARSNDGMSVEWLLAIKLGICIAVIGLLTILLRRLLSKKGVGTFTCFVIALGAPYILPIVVKGWLRH